MYKLVVLFVILLLFYIYKNYLYFKNPIKFVKIPKGTILYHSSFTSMDDYNEGGYSWFSNDKFYIHKTKLCSMYYVNQHKCKTNEFLPLNQRDVFKNAIQNKIQKCKQFTTYEVILQKDILLLQVPDEVLINFLDFMDFSEIGITGYCTQNNALGEKGTDRMVYVIKYSPTLLRHTQIKISKQDVIKARENWNISCGYLTWFHHIIKNNLMYIPYLYFNKNRLKLMERFYVYSNNKYDYADKYHNYVRFSSYNIHCWADPLNNWNHDNIIKNIISSDSDIIYLQEFVYHRSSIEKLKKYYPYFENYSELAIFSKYPLSDMECISLGRDNQFFYQRYLLSCKSKIKNKTVYLLNTHLDVFDLTENLRYEQTKKILNYINKLPKNDIILLGGDFNSINKEDYSDSFYKNIVSQHPKHVPKNMRVIKTVKESMYDVKSLHHIPIMRTVKNEITVWSMRRVDYFFVNKKIPVYFYVHTNNASDHYLIYCDLELI